MKHSEFHYRWEWDFQSNPEALWPLLSDTNRYNRDVGAPPIYTDGSPDNRTRDRRLRLSYLGFSFEYEEKPFEWFRPYRFAVYRTFSRGPVEFMHINVQLSPLDARGTHVKAVRS